MPYVDGFVAPVPKKKMAEYLRLSRASAKVWRELGAQAYVDCVADDVSVGKWTSFPRSVKLKKGEVVMFAYVVYKSRKQRDRINAKAMRDPRLAEFMDPKAMPFDGKRLIWGGFKTVVSA